MCSKSNIVVVYYGVIKNCTYTKTERAVTAARTSSFFCMFLDQRTNFLTILDKQTHTIYEERYFTR